MKEATGELNMTVITVVAIAAVAAFFYAFVWPTVRNSITNNTKCAAAQCTNCDEGVGGTRTCTGCSIPGESETFSCTYKDESSPENPNP